MAHNSCDTVPEAIVGSKSAPHVFRERESDSSLQHRAARAGHDGDVPGVRLHEFCNVSLVR